MVPENIHLKHPWNSEGKGGFIDWNSEDTQLKTNLYSIEIHSITKDNSMTTLKEQKVFTDLLTIHSLYETKHKIISNAFQS